jgi:capsular polysaccharide transport system permease protein
MQSPETSELEQAPSSRSQKFKQRILGVNRLFLLTVVLPTTSAIIYYGFMASDVYISESRFVVRTPERQTASFLGSFLKGSGFSRSQDDSYTVQDFIQSRDALKALNDKLAIAATYGASSIDRISRFGGTNWRDKSFEALHLYYKKKIVTINNDSSSSITTLEIRSFSADQAARINEQLLEMSEQLVNKLNERGRQDMIRSAAQEVADADKKDKAASLALSAYRNKKAVFDPVKQSAIQLQRVSKLQDELIAATTELAQIRMITENNPQVPVLQKRVEILQKEIATETAKVAGNDQSFSGQASAYERLVLEQSFAEKQLATALAALEQARNEALRKQLYLERIVQPNKPDKAFEPRRFRAIFTTFAVGLICWGVLTMLIAGVREHHD